MAKWEVEDAFGIDMEAFNLNVLVSGTVTAATRKTYTIELVDGFVEFHGKGFEYNKDGIPNGGVIKSFTTHDFAGNQIYAISGIDAPVKAFVKAALSMSTLDDDRLISKLFSGDDYINGGHVGNLIQGYKGNDVLAGGNGEDFISGGAGRDVIHGGQGFDTLFGDAGADVFLYVFASESSPAGPRTMDSIVDFSQVEKDRIDLSGIGDLTFAGEKLLSGVAGELVFSRFQGSTFVSADVDGDGNAEFVTSLTGEINLKVNDFLL